MPARSQTASRSEGVRPGGRNRVRSVVSGLIVGVCGATVDVGGPRALAGTPRGCTYTEGVADSDA
jgi:hypothetical protein